MTFWSCGVACCLDHPVPLPARVGLCPQRGRVTAVVWAWQAWGGLCGGPQPSSPFPPSPRWGALSKKAGKEMVLRVGICALRSCNYVIQELDALLSSTVRGAQRC